MSSVLFKRSNVFEAFTIFCVIYFSNDTLLFGTNINRNFFWFHILFLFFLTIFLLFKTKKINRVFIKIGIFILFMNSVTMIINSDFSIKFFYELMIYTLSICIVTLIPLDRFVHHFCNIVYLMCIVSIVLFVLAYVFPELISLLPQIKNESGLNFFYAFLSSIESIGYSSVPRVFGIFREPGVFMIYISLAFVFTMLYEERYILKRIIVYSITILITFSTAGYLILMILFLILLIKTINTKKTGDRRIILKVMFFVMLFCFIFIMFVGWDRIDKVVFAKLRVDNSSFSSRFGSLLGNISIFLENPLVGKGYSFVEKNFSLYAAKFGYLKAHNTNTFLKILSIHGIPFFLLFIFGAWRLVSKFRGNYLNTFLVFAVILVSFSNEDMIVNILPYLLLSYGIII